MSDQTERKIKRLFDYQRFEQEPGLQKLIDDTKERYSGGRILSDDILEFAAGGVNRPQDGGERQKGDPNRPPEKGDWTKAMCPECGCPRWFERRGHGGRAFCEMCNFEIFI